MDLGNNLIDILVFNITKLFLISFHDRKCLYSLKRHISLQLRSVSIYNLIILKVVALVSISLLFWSHVVGEDSPVAKQAERRDVDLYIYSHYDKTSKYGEYDKDKDCWTDGPTNPDLPVGDECQSAAVK